MKKAKKFTYDISQKKVVEVIYPKKESLLKQKYSRKFSCEFCEAEYSSKIKLKRHLAWIHEEKKTEELTEKKEEGSVGEKSRELMVICDNSDDEIQIIDNWANWIYFWLADDR